MSLLLSEKLREVESVYRHIVLFQLNEDVNDQQRENAIAALRGLEDTIPWMVSAIVALNVGSNPSNYDIVLDATFVDQGDFVRYVQNDAHQEVWRSILEPLTAQKAGIQFEEIN